MGCSPQRRAKAGVPEEVRFATKTQIALQQLHALLTQGAPHHCVLADAGYGVDNAFRHETINGLYKAELIHRRGPWKTRESVELATLQWVHWFNHTRLLKPIGGIPPAEAEANYWRQLAKETILVVST